MLDGKKVMLSQTTEYPWNGDVQLRIDRNQAGRFALKLRIPGWVRGEVVPSDLYKYVDGKKLGYTCYVNGEKLEVSLAADGYLTIERRWKKGDVVSLHLDMEPRVVRAHENVEADRDMIAVERGPIVYCAEHPDNNFDIMASIMNQKPKFATGSSEIAGTKVVTVSTDVQTFSFDSDGKVKTADQTLTLIPYYAWCHRGGGNMRVWLPQNLKGLRIAK